MKKLLAIVLVLTLVFSLAACGQKPEVDPPAPGNDGQTLSGTLEVWSSGEELGRFVEGFNKIYPDVKVNITVVPNSDFIAKITPTLAGGQGAPDIFTGESDYVKYLVESGYWDDLKAAPYNADISDVWGYIVSVGSDSSGVLRALSWQASPGSVMYRRDMATKVLGTDDPEQVSAMLTDDVAMLDVAAKLKAEGIKMFASWQDIFNMEFSNREKPWVVDEKLVARSGGGYLHHALNVLGFDIFLINQCQAHSVFLGNDFPALHSPDESVPALHSSVWSFLSDPSLQPLP